MIYDISALDVNNVYTYADYLTWQFPERVELIDGHIFKMPRAASTLHQQISGAFLTAFVFYLKGKTSRVFHAPFDVRFPKQRDAHCDDQIDTVVQPDLAICNQSKLDERGCLGAPELVVEILSPATVVNDVKHKFKLYARFGVEEYWLVHPEEAIVEVFRLSVYWHYELDRIYTREDVVKVGIFEDFSIDLRDVFEESISEEFDLANEQRL